MLLVLHSPQLPFKEYLVDFLLLPPPQLVLPAPDLPLALLPNLLQLTQLLVQVEGPLRLLLLLVCCALVSLTQ